MHTKLALKEAGIHPAGDDRSHGALADHQSL